MTDKAFPTDLQTYVHKSRYARWRDEDNRRESWKETVSRYVSFFKDRFKDTYPSELINHSILSCRVMPSMRALMTAGPALARDEIAGYNCSYIAVDHPRAFDEMLYILSCGTGVGFSVERQNISKLPTVPDELHPTETAIIVADSKIGWASSLRELIGLLYAGNIPRWDVSKVRPAGQRLKTFGGRASGPGPLVDLFKFVIAIFKSAEGRKLTSVECHDICCKIGDVIVSGGVRRSALISLSNLSDDRMRASKTGQWWELSGHRALANNSAVYTEKPDMSVFFKEWHSLYESKSGERGIFSRVGANKKARENGRRDVEGWEYGTNPCSEIILRPSGLCNLTEAVVRSEDTLDDLCEKIKVATIMGTFQSTLTSFRYIRSVWSKNATEERLLGVSLTGIMDHDVLSGRKGHGFLVEWLEIMRDVAISTNKEWAEKLGIPVSAAITTCKPSGTVSQLVDSASGIHARYSPFYIRTVRNSKNDPLATFMIEQGFPVEDSVTKPGTELIFSFPVKSPERSVFRNDMTAIEQLEHYLVFKHHWCEHNPSITVYVRESEWMAVGDWVYNHFDQIGGVSFLPHSDHIYKQAPYMEVEEQEYLELLSRMPKDVDWELVSRFELEDSTNGTKELACTAGVCEIL